MNVIGSSASLYVQRWLNNTTSRRATLNYEFDASGVSAITTAGSSELSQTQVSVNGANYTGGAGSFTLMTGVTTTPSSTTPTASNFTGYNATFGLSGTNYRLTLTSYSTVWDGGGGDTNINTAANWADDLTPNLTNGHNTFTFGTGGSTATINTNLNAAGIVLNRASSFEIASGAGSLTVGSGGITSSGAAHTISEGVILGANQTWDVTDTLTVSGAVSGSYNLTKAGAGTLTLSNTNTYNGSTTINAGTLQIDGSIANSGLVINANGTISPGTTAAVDSFGTSSITINGGRYNWTLNTANGSAGTGYDQITSTGALTSSGLLTVYAYGTPGDWDNAANYSWDIFSANSVSGFSTNNFALDLSNFNNGDGPTGTFTFSNPDGTGIIRLTYTASTGPVWTGGTGNWSTGFSANVTNGDTIAFSGAGGIATNNIPTGTLTTVGDIEFRNGAGAYTLAADAGSAGASGGTALTVNGKIINNSLNTQTINTDLAFAATRTVDANTGDITIGGAISGSGGLTKNGSNHLTLSGANSYTGSTTVSAGTLTVSGGSAIVDNGEVSISSGAVLNLGASETVGTIAGAGNITLGSYTLTSNASSATTLSGVISGSGGLTKSGSGTLTLSGANSYTGTTTVSAGMLTVSGGSAIVDNGEVSISSGAVLNLGASETVGTIAGAGNITLGSYTLTSNASSATTLSGVISGSGGLTKSGSGTLTLSGNNTYSGDTTINAGTLVVGGAGKLGEGSYAGNITITGAFTFNSTAAQTLSGRLSGAGLMTKIGTGTLTLGGSSNMTGTLDVGVDASNTDGGTIRLEHSNALGTKIVEFESAGTIVLGTSGLTIGNSMYIYNRGSGNARTFTLDLAGTATGTLSGRVDIRKTNSAVFDVGTDDTLTVSGNITFASTGLGGFTKTGAGTLVLTGAGNDYKGATTISAGTIQVGAGGTTGSLTTNSSYGVVNNGALVFNRSDSITVANAISGSGNLIQNGTSTLTLSGANTYSGATTINVGTLVIGNGLTAGSLNATSAITVNSTLAFNRSDDITQGTHFSTAAIGGTGSIVQNGTGNLTLNAANNYSGGTTLNTGTLVIGNTAAAGNGTITQTDATSLLKFDTTGTITNVMSVYNVLATQSATLSGAITVNNATWDVDAGDTLTVSGAVSGSGGVTKIGNGTLILSGSNSYNGSTVINAGTLNAANANALGSNNTVQVTGGTLLVSADDAVNGKNIALGGSGVGLQFSGNYSGAIGTLTLSANSIIDLGAGSVSIMFTNFDYMDFIANNHTLSIYNWTGTTLWNGGNGTTDTDKVYFGPDLSDEALAKIYFYTGPGDSFLGSGFDLGLKATGFTPALGHQIIPVPEPETWATGILLVLGGAVWMWRKRSVFTTQSNLEGAAPSAPIEKMVGLFRRNDPNQRQSRPPALPAKSATI